jgi:hypothetical protein
MIRSAAASTALARLSSSMTAWATATAPFSASRAWASPISRSVSWNLSPVTMSFSRGTSVPIVAAERPWISWVVASMVCWVVLIWAMSLVADARNRSASIDPSPNWVESTSKFCRVCSSTSPSCATTSAPWASRARMMAWRMSLLTGIDQTPGPGDQTPSS